jgi:flagellar protein FlgJ
MNIAAVNSPVERMGQLYKEQVNGEGFQAALEAAVQKNDAAELRKACEGFESYFLQIMFREMRGTGLRAEGVFAKSGAERIFEDMLYEEYSKTAASRGGIGLADMLYRQLSEQNQN